MTYLSILHTTRFCKMNILKLLYYIIKMSSNGIGVHKMNMSLKYNGKNLHVGIIVKVA